MKVYQKHSTLTFGQHKGKSIEEVFKFNPHYLEWCITDIPDFLIQLSEFKKLEVLNPNYLLPDKIIAIIEDKEEERQTEIDEYNHQKYLDDTTKDFYDQMREEGWDPEN